MGYFKKHWSADLYEDVLKCVEEEVCSSLLICLGANCYQFKEWWLQLSSGSTTRPFALSKKDKDKGVCALL
jgi:hypothetical protein